jgi:hypothetical protein
VGNTIIRTTLVSPAQASGVINEIDDLADALIALIGTYIPGLPPIKGLKNLAVSDQDRAPIPCVMVQPRGLQTFEMKTSARFERWHKFQLVWVVGDATIEGTTKLCTDGAALFEKLFSNNALSDRGTPAPSNKFVSNGTTWIYSRIPSIDVNPTFLTGRTDGPKYGAFGELNLLLQTVPALI